MLEWASMKKKQQKKLLVIIGIALVLLIAAIVIVKIKGQKTEEEVATTATAKKRLNAPINVLALDKRPVVALQPYSKNGGRFVSIVVSQLREAAYEAEYEISYDVIGASAVSASGAKIAVPDSESQEGTQGFMGTLDISNLPTSTSDNRFGTCSAGGACINNNVSGGTLTLNFSGEQKFAVMSNWTYFETGSAESKTNDEVFTLQADGLAKAKDYLIMEAMGVPDGVPGTIATKPDGGKDNGTKPVAYQINFTTAPSVDEAKVSFAGYEGKTVAVWNGKTWSTGTQDESLPLGNGYYYLILENV